MRAPRLATAVGSSALLLCVLATSAGAQERSRQRAPIIRLYSENGAYVVQTTSYVMPAIEVSENAYVFAVSMDLDGHVQVLHPDAPGISVRMLAHKELRLPNFFAGFSGPGAGDQIYSAAGYSGYDAYDNGYVDSRGTIIALASRAPFNLELIESGGDWNILTIRRLIEGRDPLAAALALANYIGAKGEPIGHDFMRFAGVGQSQYYALNAYSSCGLYYGSGYASTLGLRGIQVFNQLHATRSLRGQRVRTLGYDACGIPILLYAPTTVAYRVPAGRVPRSHGDTTVFPKYRFPHGGMTGRPTPSGAREAPEGIFPLPRRSGLSQTGEQTITAPRGRRSEPRNTIDGNRPQSSALSAPQGHIPFERAAARPQAAIGVFPAREYRPSSPPPPPPRAQTPIVIRLEPTRAPPPRRR
jgi:hypothetical protein